MQSAIYFLIGRDPGLGLASESIDVSELQKEALGLGVELDCYSF